MQQSLPICHLSKIHSQNFNQLLICFFVSFLHIFLPFFFTAKGTNEKIRKGTKPKEQKTIVLFGELKRSERILRYEQFPIFQEIEKARLSEKKTEKAKNVVKSKTWAKVVKVGHESPLKKSQPSLNQRDVRMKERDAKKQTWKEGESEILEAGRKGKMERQESLRKNKMKKKERGEPEAWYQSVQIIGKEQSSGAADNFESESPRISESNTRGRYV